jgi:membrane protease YdiL (CAAX protease family)
MIITTTHQTVALTELPTYFAYCMPRLEAQTGRWSAVLLSSFFLAAQHCTLPLIWDGRFFVWRLLMFIPFALFVGLLLRWRPQLLPYLVVVHGLMDLAMVLMVPTAV